MNFIEIAKRVPAIQDYYKDLIERRELQFRSIFEKLIHKGYLRADVPENVWSALVGQIFIVSDFWLSHNELTKRLKGKKTAAEYLQLIQHMLYPYLARPMENSAS